MSTTRSMTDVAGDLGAAIHQLAGEYWPARLELQAATVLLDAAEPETQAEVSVYLAARRRLRAEAARLDELGALLAILELEHPTSAAGTLASAMRSLQAETRRDWFASALEALDR